MYQDLETFASSPAAPKYTWLSHATAMHEIRTHLHTLHMPYCSSRNCIPSSTIVLHFHFASHQTFPQYPNTIAPMRPLPPFSTTTMATSRGRQWAASRPLSGCANQHCSGGTAVVKVEPAVVRQMQGGGTGCSSPDSSASTKPITQQKNPLQLALPPPSRSSLSSPSPAIHLLSPPSLALRHAASRALDMTNS